MTRLILHALASMLLVATMAGCLADDESEAKNIPETFEPIPRELNGSLVQDFHADTSSFSSTGALAFIIQSERETSINISMADVSPKSEPTSLCRYVAVGDYTYASWGRFIDQSFGFGVDGTEMHRGAIENGSFNGSYRMNDIPIPSNQDVVVIAAVAGNPNGPPRADVDIEFHLESLSEIRIIPVEIDHVFCGQDIWDFEPDRYAKYTDTIVSEGGGAEFSSNGSVFGYVSVNASGTRNATLASPSGSTTTNDSGLSCRIMHGHSGDYSLTLGALSGSNLSTSMILIGVLGVPAFSAPEC